MCKYFLDSRNPWHEPYNIIPYIYIHIYCKPHVNPMWTPCSGSIHISSFQGNKVLACCEAAQGSRSNCPTFTFIHLRCASQGILNGVVHSPYKPVAHPIHIWHIWFVAMAISHIPSKHPQPEIAGHDIGKKKHWTTQQTFEQCNIV